MDRNRDDYLTTTPPTIQHAITTPNMNADSVAFGFGGGFGHNSASADNLTTGNHQDQNNGISSTSWGAKSTPERGSLRPVIIDGSNVAMQLGRTVFATRGILICARHFILRGHQVVIFLPKFRRFQSPTNFRRPMSDQHLLQWLYEHDMLIYTPSRTLHNEDVRHRIICYDDYYIVENAHNTGGVIVSNDQYRDVLREHPEWTDTVQNRLIMFSWANDRFMPAEDPFGRRGPRLHDVLRFEGNESIDPLMRPWSQEKFRELVVEIERALVAPPPPPPPPGGDSGFQPIKRDHQEQETMGGDAISADALPPSVPQFGFWRPDHHGRGNGNHRNQTFSNGFNHRSRRWMQQGQDASTSSTAQPGFGFGPIQRDWPANSTGEGGFGQGENNNGFFSTSQRSTLTFGLDPNGTNGESTTLTTMDRASTNASTAPPISSTSTSGGGFLEWFSPADGYNENNEYVLMP